MPVTGRICFAICLAAAMPAIGAAQIGTWEQDLGSPLMGPLVGGVPCEADAITTASLTFSDGTHFKQTTTAHYYRDRAGQVRVELDMDGLPPARNQAERMVRTSVNTHSNPFNPST